MAKDTTLKIIDMQSFIGWEADNPYMWPANCCARAVWVDIRSKPWIVQLERDVKKEIEIWKEIFLLDNSKNYWWKDKMFVSYKDWENWVLGTINNWAVEVANTFTDMYYVDSIDINEWTYKSWNDTYKERMLFYYWKKFTWWTDWIPVYNVYIYKSRYNDNSWVPYDFVRLRMLSEVPAEQWWDSPILTINTNSKIYIAFGNTVRTQDDNEIVVNDLELPKWETIVWMTEYLWTIKLYTICWDNTYMYTWDWVDYLPTSRQIWYWIRIKKKWWVLNNWAYDYLLSDIWDLYVITWTQKQKIKVSNSEIEVKFYRLLWIKDDLLYIADSSRYIYTYWTKYPWIANNLCTSYILENQYAKFMSWNYFASIRDIYSIWRESSNKTHNIYRTEWKWWDVIERHRDFEWWYIQSMFYTIDQWKNMAFEMMKLKVDVKNYWTVLILYRTSISGNWRLFKEIDRNYDDEKISISIREFNDCDPWAFTWIQFMFVLQRDKIFGYLETTPEIGRCTVFLREIEENI